MISTISSGGWGRAPPRRRHMDLFPRSKGKVIGKQREKNHNLLKNSKNQKNPHPLLQLPPPLSPFPPTTFSPPSLSTPPSLPLPSLPLRLRLRTVRPPPPPCLRHLLPPASSSAPSLPSSPSTHRTSVSASLLPLPSPTIILPSVWPGRGRRRPRRPSLSRSQGEGGGSLAADKGGEREEEVSPLTKEDRTPTEGVEPPGRRYRHELTLSAKSFFFEGGIEMN